MAHTMADAALLCDPEHAQSIGLFLRPVEALIFDLHRTYRAVGKDRPREFADYNPRPLGSV